MTQGPITAARLKAARRYLRARETRAALRGPFATIVREAARIGWPLHYRRDLTRWDRRALMRYGADRPFAWAVRPCGTHLLFPEPEPKCSPRAYVAAVAGFSETPRWYWYDGRALEEVSPAEVIERYERTSAALRTAERMQARLEAARARLTWEEAHA